MAYYSARNAFVLDQLAALPWGPSVRPMDPRRALCDGQQCYALIGGEAMYYDDSHLSIAGARRVLRSIDAQPEPERPSKGNP